MKRIFTAILAVFYITTSTGATVHFHYCMDRLVSWGLTKGTADKRQCPSCTLPRTSYEKYCVKENKDCCKDYQKLVKLGGDQDDVQRAVFFPSIPAAAIIYPIAEATFAHASPSSKRFPAIHAPPGAGHTSLYIIFCNFRI